MLLNRNSKIIGKKVILVPYREEHVLKYHQWMQSEELQKLTQSLPLTLEQEYEMQKSWQIDEDKLTFIILDKDTFAATCDENVSMIGDTNLFILQPANQNEHKLIAEPEIMIAEPLARGKGCGQEALMIMLQYGIEKLKVQNYAAKIAEDNKISLHMFTKLGFVKTSFSEAFKEETLQLNVDNKVVSFLNEQLIGVEIKDYE